MSALHVAFVRVMLNPFQPIDARLNSSFDTTVKTIVNQYNAFLSTNKQSLSPRQPKVDISIDSHTSTIASPLPLPSPGTNSPVHKVDNF